MAGNVGGFGEGGFGVYVSPSPSTSRATARSRSTACRGPCPIAAAAPWSWPTRRIRPTSMRWAIFRSATVQNHLSGSVVTGFYLACKVGYNYDFAGLGNAWIYFSGGAGLLYPTLLFHSGLTGGVEVCGIGLSSGAEIGGYAQYHQPEPESHGHAPLRAGSALLRTRLDQDDHVEIGRNVSDY